jgi:pimeloyl-ACP methyl ester carboxylesterase
MIAVTAALPASAAVRVRAPVVLVHGAANSAAVWTYWQRELADRGFASYAIDLRGHGKSDPVDLSQTSMQDYADDVGAFMRELASPPVLMGWSMGGLVAMMAGAMAIGPFAERMRARAFVGLAPSTPARERDPDKRPGTGEYGADYYGITNLDPDAEQPAMFDLDLEERSIALASLCKESVYARGERAAGIVVSDLRCPALIVTSTGDAQWPRSRYDDLPIEVDHMSVEGASHWGLVLNRRVLADLVPNVIDWIDSTGPATR